MTEQEKIVEVLKTFVEGTLVEHEPQKSLAVIADDIIGIGMGDQGVVTSKEVLADILTNERHGGEEAVTTVAYDQIQIRCYDDRYGTICAVLRIKTILGGKTKESALGQMLSVRKENGSWLMYALQATPLFQEIEDMEAYPIKFAENALQKFRQQEQMTKKAQQDSIGIYRVNLTKGIFEDCVLKNDRVIRTEKNESYERAIIDSAWKHLNEKDRYRFIHTFSLDNIRQEYNNGQTELSLEYEMHLSDGKIQWLRTVLKLYIDELDEQMKGYLYVFDISNDKKRELVLQSELERDPLTGLYNRKYTELKIVERLRNLSPHNHGALLMLDLDYFKGINDYYGHQTGDWFIKETAKYLSKCIGANDIAGRMGGDEFCVYFHGPIRRETVLEKVRQLCCDIAAIMPDSGVTASIGIVICQSSDETFKELYQKADMALYEQKKKGRNGYTGYN